MIYRVVLKMSAKINIATKTVYLIEIRHRQQIAFSKLHFWRANVSGAACECFKL